MPIYEYACQECKQAFEEWQTGFEERELPCPICGGRSTRLISNSSFILKGGGWYVTDYSGHKVSDSGGDAPEKADLPGEAKAQAAPEPKGEQA